MANIVGKFRIRRGWFGKCILQIGVNSPSLIGGVIDITNTDQRWVDADFDRAPVSIVPMFYEETQ